MEATDKFYIDAFAGKYYQPLIRTPYPVCRHIAVARHIVVTGCPK
jgi:hypothetical protein